MTATGNPVPVITIDGASGTGKGVVAHEVASRLGWHVLDSGVLYRVLALSARQHAISLSDEAGLADQAMQLDLVCLPEKILFENREVTDEIRTETLGGEASIVGALPRVRQALLARQRAFRLPPGLVTDGRDMGTVVFPDAMLKIFLTATPGVRARRRYKQLKEKGIDVNLPSLVHELLTRDRRDQERAVAPLQPASDALCIDTDALSISEVVNRILGAAGQAEKNLPDPDSPAQ